MSGSAPNSSHESNEETGRVVDEDDRRFSAEHRLRSAPRRVPQETTAREPWYKGRLGRDLLILVIAAAIGLAVLPFADVANVDYPEARAVADRLDSAWRSILGGSDPEVTATAAGLRLHTFETDGRSLMVLTLSEPTSTGLCYAIRFGPGILSVAGILEEPGPGCTPQSPGVFEQRGSWSEVLPSERITQPWFIPLIVLLSAAGLFAMTDISIVLLTKPRSRVSSRA